MPISSVLLAFLLVTLTACSTVPKTYHLEAGGRYESRTENYATDLGTQLSQMVAQPVTVLSGNPNTVLFAGSGGQLGLTEQVGKVVTRITGFYTAYAPESYSFSVAGSRIDETLTASEIGADVSIGYELGFFRPHVSYKYDKVRLKTAISSPTLPIAASTVNTDESEFLLGAGFTLDFALSSGIRLVAQADYRVPLNSVAGVSVSSTTTQLGLRFGGWTTK